MHDYCCWILSIIFIFCIFRAPNFETSVSNGISDFTIDARTIGNNIHLALDGRLSTEALCRNASAIAPRLAVPRFCDNEVCIFGRFFDHNEIANASRSLLRNGTLMEYRPERKRECRAAAPLARNKSCSSRDIVSLYIFRRSEMMQMLWINGLYFIYGSKSIIYRVDLLFSRLLNRRYLNLPYDFHDTYYVAHVRTAKLYFISFPTFFFFLSFRKEKLLKNMHSNIRLDRYRY